MTWCSFHNVLLSLVAAGDSGGRGLRQDLPPHRVQQGPVPRGDKRLTCHFTILAPPVGCPGVRSDRVRELRGRYRGGGEAGDARIK